MDVNEKIAKAIEPDPPEITTDEFNQPVVQGKSNALLPWGRANFSPKRGWYIVSVYEEDDIPRWESRKFTNIFEAAEEAYEKLIDGYLILEKVHNGWFAYDAYDETYLDSEDYRYFKHDDKDHGHGNSAAEAICDLIVSKIGP